MKRIYLIVLTALAMLLVAPVPVQACDGILCLGTLFNVTERKQIEANKQTEIARIQAEQAKETARIEGEAATRIQEAEAQLQREVQAGQLAQAQADAQARQFVAMVEAERDKRITEIELSYGQAAAMIESQSEVAIAGINQTGETERNRIAWDSSYNIITVLVIAAIVIYWMRRQKQPAAPQVIMIQAGQRPPIAARYIYLPQSDYSEVEYPMEHRQ